MWFDLSVVEAVRDFIPPWLGVIVVVLSYLGSVYFIAPALILAYWFRRDRFAPLLGGMIACYGLMSITKSIHTASRPAPGPPVGPEHFPSWFVPWFEHAAHISNSSFPSGHAMAATILVGLLVVELDVGTFRNRLLVGLGVIGWVGFTRVGLAVHYPGDVVGGIAYGVGFLLLYFGVRRVLTSGERFSGIDVDDATAAFGLAVFFGLAALYVTSGGVANYTFAHGSRNSHIVLGTAVGGLLSWLLTPELSRVVHGNQLRPLTPTVGVGFVVSTWFVKDLGIASRAFIVVWSALFLAAVVLVPWFIRDQRPRGHAESPMYHLRRRLDRVVVAVSGKRR